MKWYYGIVWGLSALLINACNEPEDVRAALPPIEFQPTSKALILHEGNFVGGEASLSLYSIDSLTIENGVYKRVNNASLGSVGQSMHLYKDKLYIVINNSEKIEVIDTSTFQNLATITIPGSSPREILFINDTLALVTELYANTLWFINPQTNTYQFSQSLLGSTEELVSYNDTIYIPRYTIDPPGVNNPLNGYIMKMNSNTLALFDSVKVGRNCYSIVENNGYIYTIGEEDDGKYIYQFHPENGRIIKSKAAESSEGAAQLSIGPNNSLYYLWQDGSLGASTNSAIRYFSLTNNQLSATYSSLSLGNNINLYSVLDYDTLRKELYTADAKDFTSAGVIYRLDSNLNTIHSFEAAQIPGQLIFLP